MEYGNEAGTDMHALITRMAKNMRILGVVNIVVGALNCLSIIGAIFGIPILISGMRLRESAEQFDAWLDQEEGALFRALERQSLYFSIQVILLLIGLVASVAALTIAGIAIVAMFASAGQM